MSHCSQEKMTPPTTPCGESLWGSSHRGGTFGKSMSTGSELVNPHLSQMLAAGSIPLIFIY